MPLVSVEQAQVYLKAYRPEDEAFLQTLLNAAESVVKRRVDRRLEPEPALAADGTDTNPPVTKTFRVPRSGEVRVPDLRVVVTATFGGALLLNNELTDAYELTQREGDPATHFRVLRRGGGLDFAHVGSLFAASPKLSITGRWGFLPTPPEAVDAMYRIAARMFMERDARYADQVQAGIEAAAFSYYRELPSNVKFALEQLRVPKVALV